jgi:hypothetical protein
MTRKRREGERKRGKRYKTEQGSFLQTQAVSELTYVRV